ncbi:MAG TPA: pyridoxamine 5'-phosphate oxidase family protein [Solirubrobacteraceae bacterium]|nr:pyridoxamine 5'-phosphate oxidase family protein [Solirubrobacteraceae bacterium]
MGKVYEQIEPFLADWIGRQPMFFVGSAPSGDSGHVNISPKGPIGTLRVLGPHTVAYLDLVGSGAETVAHLRENGRIVVMFCAFQGAPRILRLHGRGEVLAPGAIDFPDAPELPAPMNRAVIRVDVERIADSCGYGVPLMRFEAERENTRRWAEGKLRKGGPNALEAYKAAMNARSIDGLPALEPETASASPPISTE